jgi:rod shape-determining protein MreC
VAAAKSWSCPRHIQAHSVCSDLGLDSGPRQRIRITTSRVSALGLRALALTALSIGLIVADFRGSGINALRSMLAISVAPLQWFVQTPSWLLGTLSQQWLSHEQLINDNTSLRSNLIARDSALLRLHALELENVRLRDLLGLKHAPTPNQIAAQVLDVTQDHLRQRVLIDQGSDIGIERNRPVVDSGGVYGQTVTVNPTTSEVILLSDAGHALPVLIERTGLRSIVVGTGDPNELIIPYLPRNTDVEQNDRIVTSGLGGVFPAGLPVGVVREIKRDPAQPLARIIITPAAKLDRSREVLVLQTAPLTPQTPPTDPAANITTNAATNGATNAVTTAPTSPNTNPSANPPATARPAADKPR